MESNAHTQTIAVEQVEHRPLNFHVVACSTIKECATQPGRPDPVLSLLVVTEHVRFDVNLFRSTHSCIFMLAGTDRIRYCAIYCSWQVCAHCLHAKWGSGGDSGRRGQTTFLLRMWPFDGERWCVRSNVECWEQVDQSHRIFHSEDVVTYIYQQDWPVFMHGWTTYTSK
jgi:hypothetical protein